MHIILASHFILYLYHCYLWYLQVNCGYMSTLFHYCACICFSLFCFKCGNKNSQIRGSEIIDYYKSDLRKDNQKQAVSEIQSDAFCSFLFRVQTQNFLLLKGFYDVLTMNYEYYLFNTWDSCSLSVKTMDPQKSEWIFSLSP